MNYNSSKYYVIESVTDRFERNNFFLNLDKKGQVLTSGNQRIYTISSPFTSGLDFHGSRI